MHHSGLRGSRKTSPAPPELRNARRLTDGNGAIEADGGTVISVSLKSDNIALKRCKEIRLFQQVISVGAREGRRVQKSKILASHSVLLNGLFGFLGGLVGGVLAELIQYPNAEDQMPYRYFTDSILLATGVWFMVGLAGVGLSLVAIEGLSARSAEKSMLDLYRAFPFVLLGGFGGGVAAQWVFQTMLGDGDTSVFLPRVVGWTVVGAVGGAAVGMGFRSSIRVRNGLLGGAVGGFVAGVLFDPISNSFQQGNGTVGRILGFTLIGGASGFGIAAINNVSSYAFLEFVGPEGIYREVALMEREMILGSSRNVSIVVTNDMGVAEEHLALSKSKQDVVVRCIRNSRPIVVNGSSVSSCNLKHGDVFQVGDRTSVRVRFRKGGFALLAPPAGANPGDKLAQMAQPLQRPVLSTRNVPTSPAPDPVQNSKVTNPRPTIQIRSQDD